MLGDEFLETNRDARQARGHGVARRNFNGAADDADEAIVVAAIGEQVDYTVSGVFRAAVDAEDAHGGSVAGAAFSSQLSDFVVLTLSGAEGEGPAPWRSTTSWSPRFGLLVFLMEDRVGVGR